MDLRRFVRTLVRPAADGARRFGTQAAMAAAHSLRTRDRPATGKARPHPPRAKAPPPRPAARPHAPKAKPQSPREARRAKDKLAAKRTRASLPRSGHLDALGFFIAAGLILAWPRERSLLTTFREEGWRGLVGSGIAPPPGPAHAEAAEPQRGRAATHPLKIPPRGWRDILARTWKEFNDDRITATAGGVTFFSLLALFPAMAAFVSLYGLFFDVRHAGDQLKLLAGFLPHDALNFVSDEMTRIATGGDGKLGFAFVISLLLSLWSANGALKALFDGLNVAYEEKETRGFVKLNLISLGFTLGAIAFALLSFGAVVLAPAALTFLHVDAAGWWLAALRWPALLLVLAFGLSAIYRYGPNRKHPRWRWITPGGLVAAVLWLAASLLFSLYVQSFGQFNKTYGSLGAVVGFMTWLWYSTIIVLLGAELNSEIEHQTAVDTTTGPTRPMGGRGARMADTLGAPR